MTAVNIFAERFCRWALALLVLSLIVSCSPQEKSVYVFEIRGKASVKGNVVALNNDAKALSEYYGFESGYDDARALSYAIENHFDIKLIHRPNPK